MLKNLIRFGLAGALSLGLAAGASSARADDNPASDMGDKASDTAKSAGDATKDAAKQTGDATEAAAKKGSDATKDAAKKGGEKSKDAADKMTPLKVLQANAAHTVNLKKQLDTLKQRDSEDNRNQWKALSATGEALLRFHQDTAAWVGAK